MGSIDCLNLALDLAGACFGQILAEYVALAYGGSAFYFDASQLLRGLIALAEQITHFLGHLGNWRWLDAPISIVCRE